MKVNPSDDADIDSIVNGGMQIYVNMWIEMDRGNLPIVPLSEEARAKRFMKEIILESYGRFKKEIQQGILDGLKYMAGLDPLLAQRIWDSQLMYNELPKENPALIFRWTLDILEDEFGET